MKISTIIMLKKKLITFDNYIFFGLLKFINKYLKFFFISTSDTFSGWGMRTQTNLPWKNTLNKESADFEKINKNLLNLVKNKKFILSKFIQEEKNETKQIDYLLKTLDELKWRHFIIYTSVLLAKKFSNQKINLVEAGVCDGLSIYFALSALKNIKKNVYLYDSWKKMKKNLLKKNELRHLNDYDYLDLENTKKNLKLFSKYLIYNVGYIPNIFKDHTFPKNLSWLHIDLNSSKSTIDILNFYYNKLNSKGVILFDDYNHISYEESKIAIDKFLKNKHGQFINFPTGQSLFIKL
jgi:hypothetical protein